MRKHQVKGLTLLALLISASGCTMGPDHDLDDYGAYGGRWQRTLRNSGRVGSVFSPAGAQVSYDDYDPTASEEMDSSSSDSGAEPGLPMSKEPGASAAEKTQDSSPSPDESVLESAPVALRPPASVIH